MVRTTALAIAMNQLLRSKDMVLFADFTRLLWEHTLKAAAATSVLARRCTRINPDEALLAALGMNEDVVNATIDHDQPRLLP